MGLVIIAWLVFGFIAIIIGFLSVMLLAVGRERVASWLFFCAFPAFIFVFFLLTIFLITIIFLETERGETMGTLHKLYITCDAVGCNEKILGDEPKLGEPKRMKARRKATEAGWFIINRGRYRWKECCPKHNPTRRNNETT